MPEPELKPPRMEAVQGGVRNSGRRWLCTAILVAVLTLAAPVDSRAIVNGAAVSDQRFAAAFGWMVALSHPDSAGVCTGQLIAPEWVLTAAHCTSLHWQVLVGHASRSLANAVPVADALKHPRYDAATGEFDVGLIRLAEPVRLATITVATRRDADVLLRADARAVIAGWGKRLPDLPFSERLVVSDVELRSLSLDKTRIAYFDPVSGPCGGDSGGPLLLTRTDGTRVLVGIASRVVGDLCAQHGGVGIYVNVSAVRAFIETHVKELRER